MQKYMQRTKFSVKMDEWGKTFLFFALSQLFFMRLWGLSLPSFIAGFGLFSLILLLEQSGRDLRKLKKEKLLCQQLGGKMSFQRLMLLPAPKAAQEVFQLLSISRPWTKIRSIGEGILFKKEEDLMLFVFLQQHKSETLHPGRIAFFQRAALRCQAKGVILCSAAVPSPACEEQMAVSPPAVWISEKEVIRRLGILHPASPHQLEKQDRLHGSRKGNWKKIAFSPAHALRYARCAALLIILFFLSGLYSYAVFAVFLMLLSVLCRIVSGSER